MWRTRTGRRPRKKWHVQGRETSRALVKAENTSSVVRKETVGQGGHPQIRQRRRSEIFIRDACHGKNYIIGSLKMCFSGQTLLNVLEVNVEICFFF